jgi:hypothetical protein
MGQYQINNPHAWKLSRSNLHGRRASLLCSQVILAWPLAHALIAMRTFVSFHVSIYRVMVLPSRFAKSSKLAAHSCSQVVIDSLTYPMQSCMFLTSSTSVELFDDNTFDLVYRAKCLPSILSLSLVYESRAIWVYLNFHLCLISLRLQNSQRIRCSIFRTSNIPRLSNRFFYYARNLLLKRRGVATLLSVQSLFQFLVANDGLTERRINTPSNSRTRIFKPST